MFLKYVQVRHGRSFAPYGIDLNPLEIEVAQKLFPDHSANFVTANAFDQEALHGCDPTFPDQFDVIYWAVWSSKTFEDEDMLALLDRLVGCTSPSGKLLLAFYGSGADFSSAELQIEQLRTSQYGGQIQEYENPNGLERLLELSFIQ